MNIDLSQYTAPKVLLGLFGINILKSLSPAMHQEEGRHHGLNVFYQLMDFATMGTQRSPAQASTEDLPRLFHSAQQMGFAGLNITYPCKQAVLPLLDELSPDAAAIGAVNTVVFKQGRSIGYNTDCTGYGIALKEKLGARALGRVVLVGTGGAGAAVAHAVMALGAAHLTLVDTDAHKSNALAANIAARFGADTVSTALDAQTALAQADGLVNGTPMGMAGVAGGFGGLCVPADWIQPQHWVSDVVYTPLVTPMLQMAQDKGCTTIGGDGMNLWQGIEAYKLFTGITPDAKRMARYHRALFAHRGM